MSLLEYDSAYPWAESIKAHLLDLTMPPWHAEADYVPLRHETTLDAGEMNRIIDWASGGTPEGTTNGEAATMLEPEETLGPPDASLSIREALTLAADESTLRRWFSVNGSSTSRPIRAFVIRPQNPAIVRSVSLHLDPEGIGRELDERDPRSGFALAAGEDSNLPLIVRWLAGQQSIVLPRYAGYEIPEGTDWAIQIHYAKTWLQEGSEASDQTVIDLHWTDPAELTHRIVTTELSLQPSAEGFRAELPNDVLLLNVLPRIDEPASRFELGYARESSQVEPLLLLHQVRNEWLAPYWFESAVSLAAGGHLSVHVSPADGDQLPASIGIRLEALAPRSGTPGR